MRSSGVTHRGRSRRIAWSTWPPSRACRPATSPTSPRSPERCGAGDCETQSGGFCDVDAHETTDLLVWGPPTRLVAQGLT